MKSSCEIRYAVGYGYKFSHEVKIHGRSKRQVYYSKQVVNEFFRVAGVLIFTMVNFALVSCAANGGIMKG